MRRRRQRGSNINGDKNKDAFLIQNGISVIWIKNQDIIESIDDVLCKLEVLIEQINDPICLPLGKVRDSSNKVM